MKPRARSCRHGLVGQDAVGTAAVGDDLLARIERRQAPLKLGQRDVDGARQVAEGELILRADVEHGDDSVPQPAHQLGPRDRLERVAICKVAAHDPLDLGRLCLGDAPQRRDEIQHGIVGQPIEDELAVTPRRDQPAAPHVLQVLRGVGHGQLQPVGQHLDAALALRQLLQKLKAMGMSRGLCHGRELAEQDAFGALA